MLTGFKQFMLRGNVLDLAVAVVMGAAFGAVVAALVKDLITPLIAAIVGKPDFSAIEFTVNGSKFPIGDFINALVSFILVGTAVYFFVVLPVNKLLARMRRGEAAPDPTTKKCPECLSDVPIAARRCAFCTSDGETCCSRHAVAMIDATMARRAVSEIEIYRAANLLIQRHGRDAAVEAGRLVDLMLDRGDMKGRQVWLRVRRAIV
jgi:large conductance mechanosensitive channel